MRKKITLPANISPNPFDPLGLTTPQEQPRAIQVPPQVAATATGAGNSAAQPVHHDPTNHGRSANKGRRGRAHRGRETRARKRERNRRNRESFYVSDDLMERVRNAVAYRCAAPDFLDMSRFAENAFEQYVNMLERRHNGGEPFPARPAFMRKMYARGPR